MTAPQTVADVLDAAADILEAEGAWIGGPDIGEETLATTETGKEVSPTSSLARHFCLYGAIEAAAQGSRIEFDAHSALSGVIGTFRLAEWNHREGRTQSEVVAALRAAATYARQGEKA
ncbi:DUF6197 family protein [Sphingomonas abaci]|uniref:Uncharacterized protein n=1 Tax=Sphingomonas abaci TaxID=237611 RepID=A0A7W7AJ16_9SPHN|nr:hypothetical protein [Sphingomonas abaci]MBB4616947.1 hypothetical protein [Sphingomonas abaci]